MLFSKNILAAVGLASLATAEVIQIIATSDDYFEPASILAALGDILEFHLEHTNHSVVAGDYSSPCTPMGDNPCFDSGENPGTFRYTVENTDPIPFYSSHGNECARGMVGIINPSKDHTLEDYKKRATMLSKRLTARNEDDEDDNDRFGWLNTNDTSDDTSAGGSIRAPLFAVLGVAGASLFVL